MSSFNEHLYIAICKHTNSANAKVSAIFITICIFLFTFSSLSASAQTQSDNDFSLDLQRQDHRTGNYFTDPLLQILGDQKAPPQAFLSQSNYSLKPGDILTIQLTSPESWSGRGLLINNSGDLWIPELGPVSIGGLTYKEAQKRILKEFHNRYNNPELTITVDQITPFNIYTNIPNLSSARLTVPAGVRLSSILQFALSTNEQLNTDEQPNIVQDNTSLTFSDLNRAGLDARHITIHHADQSVDTVDLASFLSLKLHHSKDDPFLLADDRIVLEPLTKESAFIGISGAVKNPIEMPYAEGDRLSDLINFSGGVLPQANPDSIRVVDSESASTTIVAISEAEQVELTANTRVVVPFQSATRPLKAARVEVMGEVRYPGTYPITEGQTSVDQILELAGGITSEALPHAAYVQRLQESVPQDPLSRGKDTVDPRTLKRASDQLREGFEYLELEAAMDQNRSFIDLTSEGNLSETTLSNGDRLIVPRDYQSVFVFGQVNRPGYQPYKANQSVDDYISQADGITVAANPERIFVIEAGTKAWIPYDEATIQSGDMIFVDRVPFDALNAQRNYEIQLKNLRRRNLQLILTSISTITAVITTYVALFR